METTQAWVHSADGTRIGFHRLGAGPSVVIVHGSISTGAEWLRVARLLASDFTCYVMDRRGHGLSPDSGAPYSIDREHEDIAAVLSAAGPAPSLLGHSFGAVCALGVALCTPVSRLVLYEPPLPAGGPVARDDMAAYARAIDEGRNDDALELGLARFAGLSTAQIGAMRRTPNWAPLSSLAPTWTRELVAIDSLGREVSHYAAIACPILLLTGTESVEHPLKDAVRMLAKTLRNVEVETLAGQGHTAMRSAPELFVEKVAPFLRRARSSTV